MLSGNNIGSGQGSVANSKVQRTVIQRHTIFRFCTISSLFQEHQLDAPRLDPALQSAEIDPGRESSTLFIRTIPRYFQGTSHALWGIEPAHSLTLDIVDIQLRTFALLQNVQADGSAMFERIWISSQQTNAHGGTLWALQTWL